jgi:hypothetical protein
MTTLAMVLAAGIILRRTNLDFGLPYIYFYDEAKKARQIDSIVDGRLSVDYFRHPSFLIYSSAAAIKLFSAEGKHPLYVARALLVGECMLAAVLLYLCGLKLGSRAAGLFASSVVALSPLMVIASQHVKEDIPLFMWLSIQLFFCLAFLDSGKRKHLYLAALTGGFAFSSKYPGLLSLVLLYCLIRWKFREDERRYYLKRVILVFVIGFLLFSPFALINVIDFLQGLLKEARHAVRGHRDLRVYPWEYLWTYHLTHSLAPGISWCLLALCIAGVLMCAFRDEKEKLLAVGFALFYLLHETSPLKAPPDPSRYMVSTLPYLSLAGGVGVYRAMKLPYGVRILVGVLLLLGFVSVTNDSYRYVHARGPGDARTRARTWAVTNIPPQASVLIDFHNPFQPREIFREEYPDSFTLHTPEREEYEHPETMPTGEDVYYIACSLAYGRFFDFPGHDKPMQDFYAYLFSHGEEVARFGPQYKSYGFVDPEVRIFRMIEGEPLRFAEAAAEVR